MTIHSSLTPAEDILEISAPVTTDSAGKSAKDAIQSVFRIIDVERNTCGTGFLHKSGKIITAAHVVANPQIDKIKIVQPGGSPLGVLDIALDVDCDIAFVTPEKAINKTPLQITKASSFPVGTQVTTWGFPSGYSGGFPLLIVGYIAGVDAIASFSGKSIQKYVVNAAFNSGNSGGPLLNMEDGTVIGVVSSKLAPIPLAVANAIEALKKQETGIVHTKTTNDGKEIYVTEGQIVAEVLSHLRSQTQLVIGHAVSTTDLISLLKREKIEP